MTGVPSRAELLPSRAEVRVISVVDDARLEPEVVGEYIDWRAATEAELSLGFARGDEACLHGGVPAPGATDVHNCLSRARQLE